MPGAPGPSLQVHSVLYGNSPREVARGLSALAAAVDVARAADLIGPVAVRFGDCSPEPVFGPSGEALAALAGQLPTLDSVRVAVFGANLGSAGGHNRLLADVSSDFVLILNPDTILEPSCLKELLALAAAPAGSGAPVGIVEARQLPFEHPKTYDPVTGDTSWASTACALVPSSVVAQVGGFDADTFFLYCDDVDLSWRVRHAGYRVVVCERARVFHDKRLTPSGAWTVGAAEEFYSAEAALLMAHKWGRPDLVRRIAATLREGTPRQRDALAAYRDREREGRLPPPVPDAARTATFVRGAYAPHRF